MPKVLITYAYYETEVAKYNFQYFVQKELKYRENIDYNIIINGFVCSIEIPSLPNVTVIRRKNKGFDFGAYAKSMSVVQNKNLQYDYFFFLNSGVFGPVLPHYSHVFLLNFHWSSIFISKFTEKIHLVGTTIVCLPESDLGGYGPKVEGFFFALDKIGLELVQRERNIFFDHPDKTSAVVNGEYGLSRVMLREGFSVDCMLRAYHGLDWSDKANWKTNHNQHASRKGKYFGKSIDPYEVIFHKWNWIDCENVNFEIIDQYKQFSNM